MVDRGKEIGRAHCILLTTVEWEIGFCVTLLQQIAARCCVTEDSCCLFLTYELFRDLCGIQKVLCSKVKMGV